MDDGGRHWLPEALFASVSFAAAPSLQLQAPIGPPPGRESNIRQSLLVFVSTSTSHCRIPAEISFCITSNVCFVSALLPPALHLLACQYL